LGQLDDLDSLQRSFHWLRGLKPVKAEDTEKSRGTENSDRVIGFAWRHVEIRRGECEGWRNRERNIHCPSCRDGFSQARSKYIVPSVPASWKMPIAHASFANWSWMDSRVRTRCRSR